MKIQILHSSNLKISKLLIFIILTTLSFGLHAQNKGNSKVKSQITLISSKNTPKAENQYIYKKVAFSYNNAIPAGNDTVWDFSDIVEQNDTHFFYFTRNPFYNSFPGYQFSDSLDSTYLRSDGAIYRVTDTLFYKSHTLVTPPAFTGLPPYVGSSGLPILKFPFLPGTYMEINNYSSGPNSSIFWREGDAYGSLVTPDSNYVDMLRVHSYYYSYNQDASHAGHGEEINFYEWYDENSELPLFKVQLSDVFSYNMGPMTHSYDTTAWLFKSKTEIPYNSITEQNNKNDNINVFPCPATEIINISSSNNLKNLNIYNMQGLMATDLIHIISENSTHSVNVRNFKNGLYYIKGQLENGNTFCKKILIIK